MPSYPDPLPLTRGGEGRAGGILPAKTHPPRTPDVRGWCTLVSSVPLASLTGKGKRAAGRTAVRPYALSHRVGEGSGVRAKKRAHPAHDDLRDVPLSGLETQPCRGERQATAAASLPCHTPLP